MLSGEKARLAVYLKNSKESLFPVSSPTLGSGRATNGRDIGIV